MYIDLAVGLNVFIYEGTTMPVAEAVASIADKLTAVWYQAEDGSWLAYQPGAPDWANTLTTLENGLQYQFNMTEAVSWLVPGTEEPSPPSKGTSNWIKFGIPLGLGVILLALKKQGR